MHSTTTPKHSLISIEAAHAIGGDTACEWINGETHAGGTVHEWRAISYAAFVADVQNQNDFMPALHAWEAGFDEAFRSRDAASKQELNGSGSVAAEESALDDIFSDTGSAIEILRDLLTVAHRECPDKLAHPCKAGAVILAAKKYVDDIEILNERLFIRQAAALRAENGGAA